MWEIGRATLPYRLSDANTSPSVTCPNDDPKRIEYVNNRRDVVNQNSQLFNMALGSRDFVRSVTRICRGGLSGNSSPAQNPVPVGVAPPMTVLTRRIRSAIFPVLLDDSWPRLLVCSLFWLSTALLAAVLLVADPVFGSFVVGIPLVLVVLVRERGLEGIPIVLFGAAIGSSVVFTAFLGQHRGVFSEGVAITGFVVFAVWVSTYPTMLRLMNRQYLRERSSLPGASQQDAVSGPGNALARIYVVRAWMVLLALAVLATAFARDLLGA
jgi:hypothetical protein